MSESIEHSTADRRDADSDTAKLGVLVVGLFVILASWSVAPLAAIAAPRGTLAVAVGLGILLTAWLRRPDPTWGARTVWRATVFAGAYWILVGLVIAVAA